MCVLSRECDRVDVTRCLSVSTKGHVFIFHLHTNLVYFIFEEGRYLTDDVSNSPSLFCEALSF